jgi:hypothetical protein
MCRDEGSLLSAYNQLNACIDWLAPTDSTDGTVLAFSDQTFKTASGGDTRGTISTISTIRTFVTGTFDFIKSFVFQNILVTGANGIKSLMCSYYFCIRSTSADV